MAVAILTSIYGFNQDARGGSGGVSTSFPAAKILVSPIGLSATNSIFSGKFSGVTVNSVIQLLPVGINAASYYSVETVAQINTKQNA